MARVELIYQGYTREYNINQEVVIGRCETCDIKIPSSKASRRHCRIFKGTGGFFLEDLGSANGTVLNGVVIGRKLLKHNDVLEVGRVRLRFIDKTEDPLVGKRLGRYQVIEKIGAGSEGVVYHARQIALNKDVALKLFSADFIRRQGGKEKVRETMALAAEFSHPNVVRIEEFGEDKGRAFCVMELISGEGLFARSIRKRRIKVVDVVRYGLSISSALVALHKRGVLHGDIKPQNMLVDQDNELKLIDLSWVRMQPPVSVPAVVAAAEDESEETEESIYEFEQVFATPQYLAPELINKQPRREPSDIYALSITLYQLLVGELPYKSERIEELLKQHLQGKVKSPNAINKRVPQELSELILAGMEPNCEQRIQTAQEYYARLQQIASQLKTSRQKNKPKSTARVKEERSGLLRFGLKYKLLALLVLLALSISYGFRKYTEYKQEQDVTQQVQLEKDNELATAGEYTKTEAMLEELVKQKPSAPVVEEDKTLRTEFESPPASNELQRLKEEFEAGKISRDEVKKALNNSLRSGDLSSELGEEYLTYLKSIGGAVDTRYVWQKELEQRLEAGDKIAAYDYLGTVDTSSFDRDEIQVYTSLQLQLQTELDLAASSEYEGAIELLKASRVDEAVIMLTGIAGKYPETLGWRRRILEFFARSNEKLAGELIEVFAGSLQVTSRFELATISENANGLEAAAKEEVSAIDLAPVAHLVDYLALFRKAFMAKLRVARELTGKRSVAEISSVKGPVLVEIGVEGEELVAYTAEGKRVLGLEDILFSSIELLLPAFEAEPKVAVGAGIYAVARGEENIARGYFEAAASTKLVARVAGEYRVLLQGGVIIPVTGEGLKVGSMLLRSSIRLSGCRILLPLRAGRFRFSNSQGGELVVQIYDNAAELVFEQNGQGRVIGRVPIILQEGGTLEIKGYWDKLLLSQNDILVGSIGYKAIGDIVVAPVAGSSDDVAIEKSVRKILPLHQPEFNESAAGALG